MEPLELLSKAVIDILKEFSTVKGTSPLTATMLKEAFSSRKAILSMVNSPRRSGTNTHPLDPGRGEDKTGILSAQPDTEVLPDFQNVLLQILESLGPMITGEYETKFCELQDKITQCLSLVVLCELCRQLNGLIGSLINDAVTRIDYANDFLVDLSRDLYRMEEHLVSYQNHNRESHRLDTDFHNDLLSHAGEIHRALDSVGNLQDVRNIITSKLQVISKAIEVKRHSTEVRLREADATITELQNNLRSYSQEIEQIKEHANSLEKEVLLDELTQINNRRAYDLQMREAIRLYKKTGEPFSLILIDIDHFKNINDTYGHKAGDKCLVEIAKLIKASLRQSDFLGRYGGEELVVILKGTSLRNARNVAEKIRFRIETTRFYYQEEIISITISLGVTEILPADTDPESPFIRVDEAMYQAKKAGRNQVCEVADLPLCKTSGNK